MKRSDVKQPNDLRPANRVSPFEFLERRELLASSDLLITGGLSITPKPVAAGSAIHVAFTIKNGGARNAEGSVTSIQLKSGDTVLATKTVTETGLALGASRAESDEILVPADTPAGTYKAVVTLDINHTAAQGANTANDTAQESFTVVVPEVKKPNLVPSAVTPSVATVHPGDSLTLAWTMSNTGSAAAIETMTDVRLGTSETQHPPATSALFSRTTPALAAGASVTQDGKITIPASTAPGTYYLWVSADTTAKLTQTTTADDFAHSVKITVTAAPVARPNLVPSGVTVVTPTAGATSVKVSWTMSNTGQAAAVATSTTIRIGQSETEFPTTVLGSKDTPALAAGASVKQDGTFTLPASLAPGRYFIWIGADATTPPHLVQTTTADDRAHSAGFTIAAKPPTTHPIAPITTTRPLASTSATADLFSRKLVD